MSTLTAERGWRALYAVTQADPSATSVPLATGGHAKPLERAVVAWRSDSRGAVGLVLDDERQRLWPAAGIASASRGLTFVGLLAPRETGALVLEQWVEQLAQQTDEVAAVSRIYEEAAER